MKILFLTLVSFDSINDRNLYTDLMREFRAEGHEVYIVIPTERRFKQNTYIISEDRVTTLKIKMPNIQKTNILEKGISTLLIENLFLKDIKKYFNKIKFDLIIYSTPPITFSKVINYIKKRDAAISYLLLKDIFPQNAIDLGMINKRGLLYRFFRNKEKKMYQLSDYIGCMSPANVEYLLAHNKFIDKRKVEVCPNSIEIIQRKTDNNAGLLLKDKYKIPADVTVFIYGGNLGKPQGIDFLLKVLESNIENRKVFFIIAGSGTEFPSVVSWFENKCPANAVLIPFLPRDEYEQLVNISDVGMIFLDKRFTIPNYPSRLLTYLEFKKPVLAATDANTDLGRIAEDNNYGFWSVSGDIKTFNQNLTKFVDNPALIKSMGESGYDFLLKNYNVDISCSQILKHFSDL